MHGTKGTKMIMKSALIHIFDKKNKNNTQTKLKVKVDRGGHGSVFFFSFKESTILAGWA